MALTRLNNRSISAVTELPSAAASTLIIPGMIMGVPWDFGSTPPSGFLKCDGSAISRTTYSALYSKITVTYGSGDGSTTFNLPDFRGRFLRGAGGSSASIGTAQSSQNNFEQNYMYVMPHDGGGNMGADSTDYGLGGAVIPVQIGNTGYPDSYGSFQKYIWYAPLAGNVDTSRGAQGNLYGKGYNKVYTFTGISDLSSQENGTVTKNSEARPVNFAIHWVIKY